MKLETRVDPFTWARLETVSLNDAGRLKSSATCQSVYKMRLKLAKSWLMADGLQVELIPGIMASAEVKTGKRRLFEFFLSPLQRYMVESVREQQQERPCTVAWMKNEKVPARELLIYPYSA